MEKLLFIKSRLLCSLFFFKIHSAKFGHKFIFRDLSWLVGVKLYLIGCFMKIRPRPWLYLIFSDTTSFKRISCSIINYAIHTDKSTVFLGKVPKSNQLEAREQCFKLFSFSVLTSDGGGGKALTMTMTPWNLPHGQWSKKLTMTMTPSILPMVNGQIDQFWLFDHGNFLNFGHGHGQKWPFLTIWPRQFWNFCHGHGKKFLTIWPWHPDVGQMVKKSWSSYPPPPLIG